MTLALVLSLALCSAAPRQGDRMALWSDDVLHLVDEIQRMHPDP